MISSLVNKIVKGVTGPVVGDPGGTAPPPVYSPFLTLFPGTNDELIRTSDLVGNANSSEGTVSFSFDMKDGAGTKRQLYHNDDSSVEVYLAADNSLTVACKDTLGALVVVMVADAPIVLDSGLHHFVASWNTALGFGIGNLFLGNIEQTSNVTVLASASLIAYASPSHQVGGNASAWCVGDLYLNFSEYLDLTITPNLRSFIDNAGNGIFLGNNGELPTGTPAIVMLQADDTAFEINSGTGGDFKRVGFFDSCLGFMPPYIAPAISLDGSSQYLERSSDFVGNAQGTKGILSFWIKPNSQLDDHQILYSDDARVNINVRAPFGIMRVNLFQNDGGIGYNVSTTSGAIPYDAGWVHVLASWNLDTGITGMYINDVFNEFRSFGIIGANCQYTADSWNFGASNTLSDKFGGCISDFYFSTTEFLDLAVVDNRRKFRDVNGRPTNLGANGEIPTGNAPMLFLTGDKDDFSLNVGTGGPLVPVVPLNDCVGSPSDTPLYITQAVYFDGSDYIFLGGELTGNAVSDKGMCSFWVKFNGSDGSVQTIYNNNTTRFKILRNAANKIFVSASNQVGQLLFSMTSDNTYVANQDWINVLLSWDTSIQSYHMYINDQPEGVFVPTLTGNIDYLGSDHYLSRRGSFNTDKLNACITDFYFNSSVFLDFSLELNRRNFIDEELKPVYLGGSGQIPTGNSPIMFLKNDAPNFRNNLGFGGNFTVNGSLTACVDNPSDPVIPYVAEAVVFDGSTYLTRNSDFVGNADGRKGTLSFWVKMNGGDGVEHVIWAPANGGGGVGLRRNSANVLEFFAEKSDASGFVFLLRTASQVLAGSGWRHCILAWDTTTLVSNTRAYLDDVSSRTQLSGLVFDIKYTNSIHRFGGAPSGFIGDMCISDFYFNNQDFIDPNIESNRRLFIDAAGAPVSLGANGELPSGTPPLIFLSGNSTNFDNNLGSGGSFDQTTGTLGNCVDIPG